MTTKIEMINKDRTWRDIICLNPTHSTVTFRTNQTGRINCPICTNAMVTVLNISLVTDEMTINDMIGD